MKILVIPVNIFFVPIFFQKLVFHLLQGFAGVVKEPHEASLLCLLLYRIVSQM